LKQERLYFILDQFQSVVIYFWAWSETEYWQGACTHLMVVGNQKRGRNQDFIIPFKGNAPSDLLPPTRSHLWKFLPPSSGATSWGASLQHMSIWGNVLCLNYNYHPLSK
jgi:hypothetical protein